MLRIGMLIMNTFLYTLIGMAVYQKKILVLDIQAILAIFMLLFLHILFLQVCVCYFNLYVHNAVQPVLFVVLLEGASYIMSVVWNDVTPYLPGIWGMYYRSNEVIIEYGFTISITLVIQIILIIMIAVFGFCINKKMVTSRLSLWEESG